jgi:sec-independent protein translocase protein TatA
MQYNPLSLLLLLFADYWFLLIIAVIVLFLFGAKKLPEIARGVGQMLGGFKRARDEFEREIRKTDKGK